MNTNPQPAPLSHEKINLMQGFVKTFEVSFPPHVRAMMLPALVATLADADLQVLWLNISKIMIDDPVVKSRAAEMFDMTERWIKEEKALRQRQALERGLAKP